MTPSTSASVIFGAFAVLLAIVAWLALFRNTRVDKLRIRLETLTDEAREAACEADTVEWLDMLACHSGLLTAGRFLLVWLFARGAAGEREFLNGSRGQIQTAQAAAVIRRHLIVGFPPLALAPLSALESRTILWLMMESGSSRTGLHTAPSTLRNSRKSLTAVHEAAPGN